MAKERPRQWLRAVVLGAVGVVGGAVLTVVGAAPAEAANGSFTVRSAMHNKCLDIASASHANGARVQMWDCHGGLNQRWYWYGGQLRSAMHNKCLDIASANRANGAPVHMWDCHGRANQRWYWDGELLRSAMHEKCLDITKASRVNGARLQVWDCHGEPHQRWYQ